MGMEICEALVDFNKQVLILSCLGFFYFSFDDLQHIYVCLNDIIVVIDDSQACNVHTWPCMPLHNNGSIQNHRETTYPNIQMH